MAGITGDPTGSAGSDVSGTNVAGSTALPSDIFNNPDTSQGVQDDFNQYVITALLREGVQFDQVQGMYPQLLLALWQDPYIQELYQAGGGLADTLNSNLQPVSDPYLTVSNLETAIQNELFDPTKTHSQFLASQGITLLTLSGKPLTSTQQTYGNNLGGGNPTILAAIAKAAQETGVPYNVALAVATAESGLDPTATGDQGCSHGLFQLNACEGEGVGMTDAQMADPYTNALTALQRFAAVAQQNPGITTDPGAWAAAAQRPADPTSYATRVNNLIQSGFGGSPSGIIPKPFDGSYPVTLDYHAQEPFGGGQEQGVDYGMPQGTLLYTPFAGTIQIEDDGKSNWGKRVFVRLDSGQTFAIGHLHSFSVSDGQRVNPGDLLGESGGDPSDPSSGESTGAHIEIQWISVGGEYLDPHAIIDPILAGNATFRSLNLTAAEGSGVSQASAQNRALGIDPILEQKYPTAVSEFQKYFGRHPTSTELEALIAHGTSQDALEAYLRTQPSHVPGVSIGMYEDVKGNLDSLLNNGAAGIPGLGHGGTDGMVQELVNSGITSPAGIQFWLIQMDIQGKMNPATYQQIYQLNQTYQQGIYNESGFDPRVAVQQYNTAQQQGLFPSPPASTHTPNAPGAMTLQPPPPPGPPSSPTNLSNRAGGNITQQ